MKLIKYILQITLLLGSIVVIAQTYTHTWITGSINVTYSPSTVYTPKNSPVAVLQWKSNEWTQNTKNDILSFYQNKYGNRLIYEAEATVKYNCHTYAWAGGSTYWMNPPNQATYWNDGSYVEIPSYVDMPPIPPAGLAVRYLSDDHSAVTTSSPGYLSSKWGAGPRFRHGFNDSEYISSNLKYYTKIPIIIGVNGLLIHSDQNYSLVSPITGTITWETSGNKFTVSSNTGTITSTNTGTGTLTAKVNGTVVATKSITVSPIPALGPMTGPSIVQPGQTYVSYRLNLVQGQGLVYNWGSSEGILTEVGVIGDSEGLFDVSSSSGTGTDTVHCTVKTNNGTTVGVFYMNVSIEY